MNSLLPTHIPEIISQIILNLDYGDIVRLCRVNKDLNRMYRDEYFWKLKVEHDYGMFTEYKPSNITYRQQYVDLSIVSNDDPDPKIQKFHDRNNTNIAARKGRIDVLQWLAQYNIYPDSQAIETAAEKDHLGVFQWLMQHNIHPNQRITYYAAIGESLNTLEWLALTRGLYPDRGCVRHLVLTCRLKALQWLAQHGIYPAQNDVNSAMTPDRLEVLKWLAQHNIHCNDQNLLQRVARRGDSLAQWVIAQYNIQPVDYSATSAFANLMGMITEKMLKK